MQTLSGGLLALSGTVIAIYYPQVCAFLLGGVAAVAGALLLCRGLVFAVKTCLTGLHTLVSSVPRFLAWSGTVISVTGRFLCGGCLAIASGVTQGVHALGRAAPVALGALAGGVLGVAGMAIAVAATGTALVLAPVVAAAGVIGGLIGAALGWIWGCFRKNPPQVPADPAVSGPPQRAH